MVLTLGGGESRGRYVIAGLALAVSCALCAPSIQARNDKDWPVKHRIVGKDGDKSENVSGIACTTFSALPRSCLVIDDEMQAAQFVTVDEGELRAGDTTRRLIDDRFDDKPLELDGEAVAYADGWFYVIGSHGHPRDKHHRLDPIRDRAKIAARIAASSQVIRLRVGAPDRVPLTRDDVSWIERSAALRSLIAANDILKDYMDRRLDENGLTIEGLAVLDGRMFVGFRGPILDDGTTPVLSLRTAALFEGGHTDARLHHLSLGPSLGVRDLARFRDGLLVLAGPTGEAPGPYRVFWWDGSSDKVQRLGDITVETEADENRKPEALLPLDEGASGLRLLILLDGAKEGGPRLVVVSAPGR
jgi:hypothetical protein